MGLSYYFETPLSSLPLGEDPEINRKTLDSRPADKNDRKIYIRYYNKMFTDEITQKIKNGEIGVVPTDTLYGVVASVYDKGAIGRVYEVKSRDKSKPCIVLISDLKNLEKFGIDLSTELKNKLQNYWPGPNSVLLPCASDEWKHIHLGSGMIAFRLPDFPELRGFISKSGPIIAPSANPERMPPAKNITEARQYFGESIDFYVDGGELNNAPSRLIKINLDGDDEILR